MDRQYSIDWFKVGVFLFVMGLLAALAFSEPARAQEMDPRGGPPVVNPVPQPLPQVQQVGVTITYRVIAENGAPLPAEGPANYGTRGRLSTPNGFWLNTTTCHIEPAQPVVSPQLCADANGRVKVDQVWDGSRILPQQRLTLMVGASGFKTRWIIIPPTRDLNIDLGDIRLKVSPLSEFKVVDLRADGRTISWTVRAKQPLRQPMSDEIYGILYGPSLGVGTNGGVPIKAVVSVDKDGLMTFAAGEYAREVQFTITIPLDIPDGETFFIDLYARTPGTLLDFDASASVYIVVGQFMQAF